MRLAHKFFRDASINTARELVGAYLCRRMQNGDIIRAKICELELYTQHERGCHAYMGRKTPRNAAMFMAGGHTYVYLCYGLHNMLNITLGADGYAAAVLIRALDFDGCGGPGKLTKKLNITRNDNKIDICAPNAPIWLESRDGDPKIITTPRIGIDYAGVDAKLPWRFVISENQ